MADKSNGEATKTDTGARTVSHMPAHCVTCEHPEREAIDRAIVVGETLRSLASRYGMHRTSLARHAQAHLSPALVKVLTEREEAGPRTVLERLEELHTEVRSILDAAKEGGKASVSLAAVRELRGILDTIARITGELNERPQVAVFNLSTSPEWAEVRAALAQSLAPYPEARAAVGRALASLPSPGDAA